MPSPFPPSLTALLSLQLKHSPLPSRLPLRRHLSTSSRLDYAAKGTTNDQDQKMKDLQAKQLKMADKAGRMKTNVNAAAISRIPPFATYARPGTSILSRERYVDTPWDRMFSRIYQDVRQDGNTWWQARQVAKSLGKNWRREFLPLAARAYGLANYSFAHNDFSHLSPLATPTYVDTLKSQRIKQFRNLKLDWKIHGPLLCNIVCVLQQELSKEKEFTGQVAVRFTSTQSLEVKDQLGKLVGSGHHSSPTLVTEYYVFTRELWRPLDDEWKILAKIREVDPDNVMGNTIVT